MKDEVFFFVDCVVNLKGMGLFCKWVEDVWFI